MMTLDHSDIIISHISTSCSSKLGGVLYEARHFDNWHDCCWLSCARCPLQAFGYNLFQSAGRISLLECHVTPVCVVSRIRILGNLSLQISMLF
jgi:hypothetical protein